MKSKEDQVFDRIVQTLGQYVLRLGIALLMIYFATNLVFSFIYNNGYWSDDKSLKWSEWIAEHAPALDLTRFWLMEISGTRVEFGIGPGNARPFMIASAIMLLLLTYAMLRTFGKLTRPNASTASLSNNVDWSSGGTIGLAQMPPPGSTRQSSTQTRAHNATGAPLTQTLNRPQTVRSTPSAPKIEPQRKSEEVNLREPYRSAYREAQELQRRYRGTISIVGGQFLNSLLAKIVTLEMTSMTQDEWIRLATIDPDRAQLAVREKRRLLEELYQGFERYMRDHLTIPYQAEEIAILCKKVTEISYVQ